MISHRRLNALHKTKYEQSFSKFIQAQKKNRNFRRRLITSTSLSTFTTFSGFSVFAGFFFRFARLSSCKLKNQIIIILYCVKLTNISASYLNQFAYFKLFQCLFCITWMSKIFEFFGAVFSSHIGYHFAASWVLKFITKPTQKLFKFHL